FASINGIPVDADVSLGLLRGDANASRTVNAADVAVAKSRAGHVIDDNSVRYDINASGLITAADIAAIKARSAANVPFTPIVAPAIASVAIEQSGVLLSQVGASRQLVAKVTDALGRRLNVPVTWSSSRPANIAVDTNGLATASSLSGVTQIVASAGGVSSAPLLAMATAPAAGAILLEDEQIVGDPVETNASAPPSVSNTYKVTLTGAPPAVGSLLINTGSKMVAGRVVQVDGSNPAVVTLGLVTLREMFPSLDIEETMDMSQAPVGIASDIAASYDVARSGNTFTFTPKAGAMQSGNAKAASLPGIGAKMTAIAGRSAAGPTGTRALPPFSSCETSYTGGGGEGAPLPIALSAPPLFSVSVSPTLDFSYKFTAPQGIERFIVNAEPTIKIEGGINISAAFEGKIECKSELFAFRIPVGGPLALIIGGLVPVGVGIEAGGKMTVATMGIGTKAEVKAKVKAGIVCPGGGFTCSFDNALTDFDVKVTPTIDTPSIGDIRLEPSLSAFGYLEAAVGNPILKSIRFDFIKVKAGAELAGSFALKESQLADAAYQSDYKLSLKAGAGAGGNLSGALTLLGMTSVSGAELSISTDLAKSPAGLAAGALVADKSTFTAGEIVNFTVKLDPATLDFFPVVGPYNVKKVQLVRKVLGVATVVDTINANPGEDTFNFTYVATHIGNAGEFSAFVVTWLLPLDLLALEVGTASVVLKDSLATGRLHSCALTASRGVKCWGNNEYGQLGDGSNASRASAVDVVGLSTGVAAVAAGANHTCALKTDGGMMCWGANGSGQLGDNTKVSRNNPTDVVGLASGVAAIAPGAASSCALTTGGAVKCWGNNSGGELGDGTYVNRILPGNVSGLASGVTAIAAGAGHTCALIAGGGVKCWAYSLGFEGPAPDFKDQFQTTPVFVSGVSSGITAIAASANAAPACALTTGGAVKCWNLNGLTPPPSYSINGLSGGVAAISVGGEQLCALTTAGGLKCGSATNATAPADVMGLTSGVIGVSAGGFHTCARIAGGGVKCWGYNFDGQIGNGTNTDSAVPVSVVGFP
ncbi:MAG: hypothetical protein JNN20_08530, partial [Betaproteobacteria bacterium]|nr:hypothetical protein [Betaproteobacteria bacterium]